MLQSLITVIISHSNSLVLTPAALQISRRQTERAGEAAMVFHPAQAFILSLHKDSALNP